MTQSDRDLLAERLVEVQGIKTEDAYEFVAEISNADADIAEAAMSWCRTGIMPKQPVVEGMTPESLDKGYFPGQTFSILIALRRDAKNTLRRLRFYPGRDARPGRSY
jgi:hypothetical protein